MKKILFLSIFSLWIYYLHAQSTTIKTPTDVTIDALVRPPLSYADSVQIEADAAGWLNDHNSKAVRADHATNSYNCHAYAWHVKDGGNKVWLNAHDVFDYDDDPENLKKYWSGSKPTYSSSSANSATVAFYGSCWEFDYSANDWVNWCDHSAEVISPGYFESKWGNWPRYEHSYSDCPYVSTNIQYYNVPISGDYIVCTSKTYSTVNITGANYNWSSSKCQ